MNGRFDALATCRIEGPRVRERGVVSTNSALEADDSKQDLAVSRSMLGQVLRYEGPHHTHVQQRLNHLGLQHSFGFSGLGGRPSYSTTPGRTV